MKIYIGTYINHPDSFVIVTYNTTIGIHDMQLWLKPYMNNFDIVILQIKRMEIMRKWQHKFFL